MKNFTTLKVAIAALLLGLSANAMADEVVLTFNTSDGLSELGITEPELDSTNGSYTALSGTTYSLGNVSMETTDGSTASRIWKSTAGALDLRIYKTATLTLSMDGYNITGITMTGNDLGKLTADSGTYSSGTWEGAANSVVFTASATVKIKTITVTYQDASAVVVSKPVASPAGGTYTEAQSVTLSCDTEGATIYYTTDGTAPTNASTKYSSAIAISETTTLKAIAYVGDDASSVMTETYTIVSADDIYENIAALKAAYSDTNITGTLKFTDAQVTYVNGSNMYVQDATGAVCLYNSGLSYTAGQILNGTAVVTYTLYKNLPEITGTVDGSNLTATDGTATPVEMSVEDALKEENLCKYISMTGATVEAGYATDGTNTVALYDQYKLVSGSKAILTDYTGTYNIVAIAGVYNTTYELFVISMTSEEEDPDTPETDVVYNSIAEAKAAASTTAVFATLNLTDALVEYVNGNYCFITDGEDGILVYYSETGLSAGDKVSGSITGNFYIYKNKAGAENSFEVVIYNVDGASMNLTTSSTGNEVTPVAVEMADLTADARDYESQYVVLEGVSFVDTDWDAESNRSCTITQDGEEIEFYNQFKIDLSSLEIDANETYTVYGIVTVYNGVAQLYVLDIKDIIPSAINAITVDSETVKSGTYTIAGQKVNAITKGGLYIINGKKVFVK